MDAGKCFADVIGDPQALNDFLSNAQLLANQAANSQNASQQAHSMNKRDFLTSIVATATGRQVNIENNDMSMNHHALGASSTNYGNTQLPNYANTQASSHDPSLQISNAMATKNFNYMPVTSQIQAQNSLEGSSVAPNNIRMQTKTNFTPNSMNFNSLPGSSLQTNANSHQMQVKNATSNSMNFNSLAGSNAQDNVVQSNPTQVIYGNAVDNTNASQLYNQKTPGKYSAKHVPNILSKGNSSTANTSGNQTILLPANMGGKYIIVNNSGQAPQSAGQTTANQTQKLTHNVIQNNRQQNQQVVFLPGNVKKMVAKGSTQKQGIVDQRVNSPRQQANQPISVSPQVAKQSVSQKSASQKVAGTILPRQASPLQKGTQLMQQKQLGLQSTQSQDGGVYQMQNAQALRNPESVKIVRPAVQPRGILPKPGSQMISTGQIHESNADSIPSTSKLSHYPVGQTQIQNLQNLVSQQDMKPQFPQAAQQLSGNNQGTVNALPKVKLEPNMISQASLRPNVPIGSNYSMSNNANNVSPNQHVGSPQQLTNPSIANSPQISMKTGSNIALQQLLQLSQAATNSNSKDTAADVAALVQKSIMASQNRSNTTSKQNLLQQALAGANAQVFLQPGKQQQTSDAKIDNSRVNLIEKNLQNILNRQNANKQGLQKKGQVNSPGQSAASSTGTQQAPNQPLQLFMPKQLTQAQLMELQQKLLAGKMMQKLQETQKAAVKSEGATTASKPVLGQSITGLNSSGNKQTFTLKQIPGTSNSAPSYQFVASAESANSNQPASTRGLQVFLKQNPNITQATANAGKGAAKVVMSNSNQVQKLNSPLLQGANATQSVQGVRIQNATAPNIVIKQIETSGNSSLSEQQRAMQNKKLQQLLLQLTPAQRNLLLVKQQELVSKGQSVPLAKLIYQVKQDNKIVTVKTLPPKDIKLGKRPVNETIDLDESSESKVAKRLKHCLTADQTRIVEPAYSAPFVSVEEALSRLLPYHICDESIPPDIEWQKAEAVFGIVAKQLIARKDKLLDKYHMLMLEESQYEIPSSEMVMLERIFLADEKAKLAKDKEDVKSGKLKLFPDNSTSEQPVEAVEETNSYTKDLGLGLRRESSLLSINEDIDIERESPLNVGGDDDTMEDDDAVEEADAMEEGEVGEEYDAVEEEDAEEEDEDEANELDEEGEENVEEEAVGNYVEIDDGSEVENAAADDDDDQGEYNEQEGLDIEDEQVDSEEDGIDDDDDDDQFQRRDFNMDQVVDEGSNNEYSDIVEMERTNEQNMSEELSEATFNLMADLENDIQSDYYL